MSETIEIEIHVLLGETGDYVFGRDRDDLVELYTNEHGPVPTITKALTLQLVVVTPGATVIRAEVDSVDGPIRVTVE